jgi:uncharacterized protein (TIGR02147 family)
MRAESMAKPKSSIRVFDYTDYRTYLGDYYKDQKALNPYFSYRYFAGKAHISSIGLYKDVVDRKQSLSRRAISKFSDAIRHTKREAEYFEAMVFFSDATTIEERKNYFERMMACRESKARLINASSYEYYTQWYYSAVRALLSFFPFDGNDFTSLANKLSPPIKTDQAKKAIEVLLKLGMIQQNSDGFFEPCDQIITTGLVKNNKQSHVLSIIDFQKIFLTLAAEAYGRYTERQMDMSSITLSVSHATRRLIKEEAAAFRRKVLSLAENDTHPDCVYQLNCQLFPLTDPRKDE